MQTLEPKDNSRFEASFLRAPIGLFHLSLDGKWLEVNSYFCELLGYQREDFTPLSLMAIAHPEEREEIQAAIHQLQTKQSTNYQKNLRLLTTQNTFIQISLTLSWIEDTPAYLLGIVRELTPQELEQNSENELEKDLLKTLIDTIGDIAFVKDMQGRFLFINQAGLRGINKTLEEIIGKTDIELFGSELGEILIENDRQVFASEKLHEFEEIVDFEGERRIFLTQKNIYRDRQGNLKGTLGITKDITERKHLEQEVLLQQQQFNDFFNAAPVGMLILDRQLKYVRINPLAAAVHGLPMAEHIGKQVKDIVPHIAPLIEPLYRQVLETGQAILNLEVSEESFTQSDNPRSWEVSYFPLQDETGTITGLGVVGIETTEQKAALRERKRAEEALRASEQRYQNLAQLSPVGIFQTLIDGECIYANERTCYLTGRTAEELLGGGWMNAIHPDDRERMIQEWQKAASEQNYHYQCEYRFLRPNGEICWVLCQTLPELEADGTIKSYVGTLTDISAHKNAEQAIQKALEELQQTQAQLIQSEKMSSLGQLVAGVAHEINNPVNFIYGNLAPAREYTSDLLELLHSYQTTYPNPSPEILDQIEEIDLEFLIEDLPRLLSSMEVGADRIRQIVLSLRNFSRLDEAEMKAVDIHEGIDSTLLILQNRLKFKADRPAIAILKDYSRLPRIECYAGQLNQVFMNILTNAIDALEEYNKQRSLAEIQANPSTIQITTHHLLETARVAISIKDNGPGMSESVRSRLFNPFFTTKPVGQGTGLGLAISHQIIVEKHGGSLQCTSQLGQGSEFRIEIPLRQTPIAN
ncbi:PAS domain-containing protein [Desertifilum sp. FACHB-1129]|uniref:histidine kinase n=1 Tax=Desertifilum tharense IPPAS B-1220 TaxID=1781255 RepID=A0A1E5QDZ4_9CYAN|nr:MULTISPECIES: PAS domain-containing protein [Desertifilum]MDA0209094.1 PAS domain-containing protein [Cyanobacteria bacterium FC1]MBD2310577.1 PAS domain-containing protein [Desertifilum sp. FACHB-1129]MBD2322029.1 PAS domain-containing protein [Desertifilum sp. FACHB-866]MBD2332156.1 PAS domain-containing protein [Desertifilum sp. FACHB-868]OEJ72878.1 hypothetical protein BH720_23200 [Desertifilum tharense IPPAS B-1220]